tara:strand:- start:800 stop:1045 length:246 start_codon:yes stop_codon:yes gene_type:complete
MSHPGNDEIIDNERDNPIDDKRLAMINKMVHLSTEMGIGIVQEIIEETVRRKPGMSVKEFTKVLDLYLTNEQAKAKANNNG